MLYSDKAYQYILDSIKQGSLKAGDIIREEKIANELHISRSPIRTALTLLASEGILFYKKPGMVVNDIIVTPARFKLLSDVPESFLISMMKKLPVENFDWPVSLLRTATIDLRKLSSQKEVEAFTEKLHYFFLLLLQEAKNPYFMEYSQRSFYLIEQFGKKLPILNIIDIREWVINQLNLLINQLTTEQTAPAIKTVRMLFRELQVQAYRLGP